MCKKKKMSSNNEREKLREKYYREGSEKWIESEQKRLNQIFSSPGDSDIIELLLNITQYSSTTLDKVRNSVESGDRNAMLALLAITADSLIAFEVLSPDIRTALASGLKKMIVNLEESSKFIPRGSGKPSKNEKQKQSNKEYWTALSVEFLRAHKKI